MGRVCRDGVLEVLLEVPHAGSNAGAPWALPGGAVASRPWQEEGQLWVGDAARTPPPR